MKTKFADCSRVLITLPYDDDKFATVTVDWHVRVRGWDLTIPADTKTDGASIPRFLWRVCGHPLEVPRVYAAAVHDWLYAHGHELGISRAEADAIYYALLRHFGIAAWRAGIEYTALRLCGARHYIKGSKK